MSGDKNNQGIKSIKQKSAIREYTEAAIIAILLALFIRTFVVQAFKIPSGSMKPTLLIGDHLLVNKFIYGIKLPFTDRYLIELKKPERGDIVVFKWPRDEKKDFIKRIIGVGHDTLEIRRDVLYINNEKIDIKYIEEYRDFEIRFAQKYEEEIGGISHHILDEIIRYDNFGPVVVPEGHVFVMGDNRDNSQDSRYWGFVSVNKIKGKALIIYWSWPNWKRFLNLIR